jgi:hypothetical protein
MSLNELERSAKSGSTGRLFEHVFEGSANVWVTDSLLRLLLMESRTTRQFWRLSSSLPPQVQVDARRAYRLFHRNAAHPGLGFKKLEWEDDIYQGSDWSRLPSTASHAGNRIVWYWIGGHADYDRLV